MGLVVDGANRHDMKLLAPTLESPVVSRPPASETKPQHLCLDKGYDYPQVRELAHSMALTLHLRTRGEEIQEKREGRAPRRWVIERTHSWINRFRRLLIRWEKKVENYVAMLSLACAWICFRNARVFG